MARKFKTVDYELDSGKNDNYVELSRNQIKSTAIPVIFVKFHPFGAVKFSQIEVFRPYFRLKIAFVDINLKFP